MVQLIYFVLAIVLFSHSFSPGSFSQTLISAVGSKRSGLKTWNAQDWTRTQRSLRFEAAEGVAMKDRFDQNEESRNKCYKCPLLSDERRQDIFNTVRVQIEAEQPCWNWYAQHITEVSLLLWKGVIFFTNDALSLIDFLFLHDQPTADHSCSYNDPFTLSANVKRSTQPDRGQETKLLSTTCPLMTTPGSGYAGRCGGILLVSITRWWVIFIAYISTLAYIQINKIFYMWGVP